MIANIIIIDIQPIVSEAWERCSGKLPVCPIILVGGLGTGWLTYYTVGKSGQPGDTPNVVPSSASHVGLRFANPTYFCPPSSFRRKPESSQTTSADRPRHKGLRFSIDSAFQAHFHLFSAFSRTMAFPSWRAPRTKRAYGRRTVG